MLAHLFCKKIFLVIICILSFYRIDASTLAYKFVDLGLQESDRSEALAVNDACQIVGSHWMFGQKYYFIWSENNGVHQIELPESAVIMVLNNVGQIAGNYKDEKGNDRGFIWDQNQGFLDIGTLGGNFTRVYDMNDLGQIVGESESGNASLVDGRNEQKAFIWQNSSMRDLGGLNGDLGFVGDRSQATSINNLGQIIGISNYPIAHKAKLQRSKNRAVIWQNDAIDEISRSSDPEYSAISAISINDSGLATFEDSELGFFVVDTATMKRAVIDIANQTSRFPEITESGDIFLSPRQYSGIIIEDIKRKPDIGLFKKDNVSDNLWNYESHKYVYFHESYDNPEKWRRNIFQSYDFNNKRWIVGSGLNIYNEPHAVLLEPQED